MEKPTYYTLELGNPYCKKKQESKQHEERESHEHEEHEHRRRNDKY